MTKIAKEVQNSENLQKIYGKDVNIAMIQVPFPGAGDNLKGIFNKTVAISKDVMCSPESYPATRRFLICFLLLADKLSGPVSMSEVRDV